MRDDLKAAARSLRSSKGVTIVVLIVLTLGLGATPAAAVVSGSES
ncbi:MAG TPA: hypothetical protein VL882_11495 [Vicinamibacterales bacterium]|nr:hypothetical protein [Vicinamibacterales bacterium]